eukprot:2381251-Prymnesium_polylepis.1
MIESTVTTALAAHLHGAPDPKYDELNIRYNELSVRVFEEFSEVHAKTDKMEKQIDATATEMASMTAAVKTLGDSSKTTSAQLADILDILRVKAPDPDPSPAVDPGVPYTSGKSP